MEKIIIRKKIIPFLSSRFIRFLSDNSITNIEEYINKCGFENIFLKIFEENPNEITEIQKSYINAISTNEDNEYFKFVYKYDDKFCVSIDSHIKLYKIDDQIEINGKKLLKWIYPEIEKYLGDVWWFTDEEIFSDIKNLNLIEFLSKYKGI